MAISSGIGVSAATGVARSAALGHAECDETRDEARDKACDKPSEPLR